MPNLRYFIVGASAAVDRFTGRASVFDILDNVLVTKVPTILPGLTAMSFWHFDDAEKTKDQQVILRVTTPGGKDSEFRTNFTPTGTGHRLTQRVEEIPIEDEGILACRVFLNGNKAGEQLAIVTKVTPQEYFRESASQES